MAQSKHAGAKLNLDRTWREFVQELCAQALAAADVLWRAVRTDFVPASWQERLTRKAPPSAPQLEPNLDEIRVRPGDVLKEMIQMSILNKLTLLVEGPPGVGKSYTILEVLKELTRQGTIRGFVYWSATKSLNPDQVWQPDFLMVSDGTGSAKMMIRPTEWQSKLGDGYAPLNTITAEQKRRIDRLDNTVIFFLDEASRASQSLLDSILAPMESRIYQGADGRKIYAGIRWICAGNPAGMDQSATAYSPAFLSRFDLQGTLTNPDLSTLVTYITMSLDDADAEYGKARPSREMMTLAAGISQLLGGLPLTRPCYAEAPSQALELIERAAALDPALKAMLEGLGTMCKFPPDARKPAKWVKLALLTACKRARQEDKPIRVTPADLTMWAVFCLSPGIRKAFAAGAKPHLNRQLDLLIAKVVRHVLASRQLRELILSYGSDDMAAEMVSECLFQRDARAGVVPEIAEILEQYRCDLISAGVPDAREHFHRFMGFVTRLRQALRKLPPEQYERVVAEEARAAGWLTKRRGELLSQVDAALLGRLAALPHLHQIGKLVASLRHRKFDLEEFVRNGLNGYRLAAEFAPEFRGAVRRHPSLAERLPRAAEVLEMALAPPAKQGFDAGVREATECVREQSWKPTELAAFRHLLNRVAEEVDDPFRRRLKKLGAELRNM